MDACVAIRSVTQAQRTTAGQVRPNQVNTEKRVSNTGCRQTDSLNRNHPVFSAMQNKGRWEVRTYVTHRINSPPHPLIRTNSLNNVAVGYLREGKGVARVGEVWPGCVLLAFEGCAGGCWGWGCVDLV